MNVLSQIDDAEPYSEVLAWSRNEQLRYVRGFADGEGGPRLSYHKSMDGLRSYANIRMVVISNTDLKLLSTIKRIPGGVGIESRIYLDHRAGERKATKNCCALAVLRGQSLERFARLVGFTNKLKAEKLPTIVKSYKRYSKRVKFLA